MSIKAVPVAGAQGVKFSLSTFIYILVYLVMVFGFIVTAVVLVALAQNQNNIYGTANKVGSVVAGFINNGQSLSTTVSNCIKPFKVFWNVLWTFIFAIIQRIGNANNVNIFHQYSRFAIVDVLCDLLLPTFEVVINFLIMVLNFLLQIVLVFLQFIVDYGFGNFSADFVVLQVLFNAFLDVIDPDRCVHPVTGPFGFPGNILKCMGCTIPVPVMNQDDTTKTNAVFVCACGGDLNGTPVTNMADCIQLEEIIDAFETFGGYFVTAFDFVANLVTGALSINSIWQNIQDTYNSIVAGLAPVKNAICKIPFVCKVLNIRSLPSGADDPYICSYSIDSPNDPPVCFYESEFGMHHYLNISYDSTLDDLRRQMDSIVLPVPGKLNRRPVSVTRTLGDFRRDTTIEVQPRWMTHRGVESPMREFMIGAAVFLKYLPQSLHDGKAVSMETLHREFRARDFRPHEVRRGMQNMVRAMRMQPLNFDDVTAFRHYTNATGNNGERANPPPTQILFTITTYLVSFSMNGITNMSQMIRSMASVILPIAATLVPLVIQLAFGAIQDIVPSQFVSVLPIFNLFGPISDIFTPLYNLDATQAIPLQLFTDAFALFSTLFNNVLSSKIGVVIIQYIFTLGILVGVDGENRPPVHPDIGSISELLTIIVNCNPQAQCHTPNDCGLSQCNCGNGTVVATTGYCEQTGSCYCFPMFLEDVPQPQTTITLGIDLVGEDYGYVTKNPVWPFNTVWGSIVNSLSTFWNGAVPHVLTTLAWGLYVPWFTAILHYTIGWCPCCTPITGFLFMLSTTGTAASIALQVIARPTTDYCSMRSAFYCRIWKHFVRPSPTTWGQHILFGMNYGTSSFGLVITVVIAIVVVLFILIMMTALFNVAKEIVMIGYRWYVYSYNSETDDPVYQIHTLDTDDTEIEDFGLDQIESVN